MTREQFRIESVKDAGGKPVHSERPDWGNSMSTSGLVHGILHAFCVSADAAGPLTISGTTAVPFAYETKEVRLSLEGDGKTVREDTITLAISGFSETGTSIAVSVKGTGPDGTDLASHLGEGDVSVLDAEGRKHRVIWRGGGGSLANYVWNFEGSKIEKPTAIVLPWITKFHWVEIPFRFEGVRIPPGTQIR